MKKIVTIGLVMLLAVNMLAMASGSSNTTSSVSVTTIRVWTNDASNKAECDKMVAEFNAGIGAQKGIKVEYTVYGSDWQTAMGMALETGQEPELFKAPTGIDNYYAQGKLLPFDEIPGIEDILKAQEPYRRKNSSFFENTMRPYSVILYGWTSGFHYNKVLLQRAGFSAPPKTWAEFEQMAIAISRLAPDIYGYAMPMVWYPDFGTWLGEYAAANSIGHPFYNPTTDRFESADYTPYYEMLARMREANALFPGMESLSDDQQRAQFAAGKIGFIGGAGWNVAVLYEQFPFANPNDWDYAPLPVQNPNNVYRTPLSASGYLYASAQVKNDKDKLAKIGEVIRLFTKAETQTIMYSGGYFMPLRPDVISKAPPNPRPQWGSYGLVAGGYTITWPANPINRLTAEGLDFWTTLSRIVTGQVTRANIRATLEDLDRRYNAALQQAYTRGTIRRDEYADSTFVTRMSAK